MSEEDYQPPVNPISPQEREKYPLTAEEVLIPVLGKRASERYAELVKERRPQGMTAHMLLVHEAMESTRTDAAFPYAPGKTTAREMPGKWDPDA